LTDGIVYQVLVCGALVRDNLLGLKLGARDECSFGFKLQASYPGAQQELPDQPHRTSVESDVQFYFRDRAWKVGIDLKHSSQHRTMRLSDSRIADAVCALATGDARNSG